MTERIDYREVAPKALQAISGLETYLHRDCGLERRLIHLLKLRASQINGCAYCVDMHTKEAQRDGLGAQWIALVCVWREARVFEARERALLGWTEALTRLGESGVPDAVYEDMRRHFSEVDIVNLTLAVATINVWNRMAVALHTPHPLDDPT